MSKIPCKKCGTCGVYHDLSVEVCDECNTDIKNIPAYLVETDEISPEQYGNINESITVYVQKCSACGALNFIADMASPVKVCHNCHKTRVAAIVPVLYQEEEPALKEEEETPPAAVNGNPQSSGSATVLFGGVDDDDDDDDDEDSAQWQGILGNIKKTVASSEPAAENTAASSVASPVAAPAPVPTPVPQVTADDDDDDDDDDVGSDWAGILGGTAAPKSGTVAPAAPSATEITLTALRYGSLSFTVSPEPNVPYMLGRSANQGSFLSADGRVSNNHCYLIFKNGSWYVKDNNSANGTAVNSIDIGLNGESILRSGDTLKLGHHPDSMEFRITLGK